MKVQQLNDIFSLMISRCRGMPLQGYLLEARKINILQNENNTDAPKNCNYTWSQNLLCIIIEEWGRSPPDNFL